MATADRIIDLLHEARTHSPGMDRERFLAEACGEDAALQEQVSSLLEAEANAGDDGSFLKSPIFPPRPAPPTEKPGDRIGRYKLLQQIGEGGCGVVYLAEQEEPVRRCVALKVIKLGMDTKAVIARFEAERQALALMDHPNIARVLDAGATETGRPFFVMELVRGIKITEFCDRNDLPTEARLGLFTQVCHAIQHAHQKGIIHRDIKPSNILVTLSEPGAPGTPKVIDFGIAKATTGERLTDKTIFTAFEQFMGTPAYMSPEQAVMTDLDIDTRTDIYALGVLLYELLTGRTPFDAEELMAAGLDAMRRIIHEQEPVRPSTRLSTMLAADLTEVARHRHSEPAKLGTLLRGDLDWIVMKALEKDRARRYETANGLAMDIQRHLSSEPIIARPPSVGYRFQKLVRRNKIAFAAAGAIMGVLISGVIASTWQALRATHAEKDQIVLRREAESEKRKAQTEAAKANAISDFLQHLLSSANPDMLKGSDYSVRQLLDDFSAGLEDQLDEEPEVEVALRATIGRAYHRLGVAAGARSELERALELQRSISGEQSEPVAGILKDCAWSCFEQGQPGQAEVYAREAMEIYQKQGIADQRVIAVMFPLQRVMIMADRFAEVEAITDQARAIARKTTESAELASMIHGLADVRNAQARYAEAESLARNALEIHRRQHGAEHPETAWALFTLGVSLRSQQELDEAEAAQREARRIFSRYYPPEYKTVDLATRELRQVLEAKGDAAGLKALEGEQLAEANRQIERNDAYAEGWIELARLHTDLKQWAAAIEDYAKALALYEKMGTTPPVAAELKVRIAELFRLEAKWTEAEEAYREALAISRKSLGNDNPEAAQTLHRLGDLLRDSDQGVRAEEAFREAVAMRRKLFGNENLDVGHSLHGLAWVLNHNGKREEAETLSREELALRRKLLGNDHPEVSYTLHDLAGFLRDQGKLAEAEATVREALAIRRKRLGNDHTEVANSLNLLSGLLVAQGKLAEAEALNREELVARKLRFGDVSRQVDDTLNSLARVLEQDGRLADAESVRREELEVERKLSGNEHLFVANSLQALGRLLCASEKLDEAEVSFREALAIRIGLSGEDHAEVAAMRRTLADVLGRQGKYTEAKALYLESAAHADIQTLNGVAWTLATSPASELRDGPSALTYAGKALADSNPKDPNVLDTLAAAYAEVGQFTNAVSAQQEAIALSQNEEQRKAYAVRLRVYQSNLPYRNDGGLAIRASTLLAEGRFVEAEPLARECLALREVLIPDGWQTFNARSLLGGSLLGQRRYSDAEPLLLSGYEGLRQRDDKIPAGGRERVKEALQRLAQLCEATDQPEQAEEWKQRLEEFDQAAAEARLSAPQP